MKKILVAITGNIGSGKSTFSQYLISKGCAVIIADDISKDLLKSDKLIKEQVIDGFGKSAYSGGELNKKFIAGKVFSNPKKLQLLNSILHPKVISEIDSIISKNYPDKRIIFIESALVYETEIEKRFDFVVLIAADFNIRMKRGTAKGKFTEDDFNTREQNQIPQKEKEKRADFIFFNNGTREELFIKADLLLLTLGSEKI